MVNKMPKKRARSKIVDSLERKGKLRDGANVIASSSKAFLPRALSKIGLWLSFFALSLLSLILYIYVIKSSAANSALTKTQAGKMQTPIPPRRNKTSPKKADIKKGKGHTFEVEDFKATIHNELSPKSINFNGRSINLKAMPHKNKKSSVHVYIADNFLSKKECEGLSEAHLKHVAETSKKSPIVCFANIDTMNKYLREIGYKVKLGYSDFTHGTSCVNATFSKKVSSKFKYSYSTAFYRSESKFANFFEKRVEEVTKLAKMHGGKFQITSYQTNVGYKNHTDCTEDSDIRDRFATVLVYLKDVEKGGETKFPRLGINVKPKQGRLLVWNNMRPDGSCDPTSIHNAAKVERGHKIIIQRWYYYKNFFSLGKRPPEPDLPEREELQPRVSCDEFEQGSCRWYDEWGYDHLTSYQLSKHNLS